MKRITASPGDGPRPPVGDVRPLDPARGRGSSRSGARSGAAPTSGRHRSSAPGRRFASDPILVMNFRFVPTHTSVCHHFLLPRAALGILISKFPGVVSGRISIWTPFVFVSKPGQAPAGGVLVRPATKISVPAAGEPALSEYWHAARHCPAGGAGSLPVHVASAQEAHPRHTGAPRSSSWQAT